ncbi:MAG TPA: hypothetical protein VMT57_01810 [Candidatus Thermoplasmatota archaeon]|nr:hypothetical protein [Candidatus Thermoplasmatota archaeon]
MRTSLRKVEATIILGMILMGVVPFFVTNCTTQETKSRAISFHTYLDLNYTSSDLNQPLQIDRAISVPVTINFWTDITLQRGLFSYLFLYGSIIAPNAQINLEILNPPDWANIYFGTTTLLADYPLQSEGKVPLKTSLIISPKVEAPAESQRIDVQLSIPTIKRVNGFTTKVTISFTPQFVPTIGIDIANPIRTVGPHESVTFSIDVLNKGNKITRVTPTIAGVDPSWTPTINPPYFDIPPAQQTTFSFSIITPYNFGWHNEYGRFQINFQSQIYPPQSNSPTSNESIYLVVNNHGFSTPGFEVITFLTALIGIVCVIRFRHKKNS